MSVINVGFDNNSPQAIDRSYGALSAGKTVPFTSVAAANAGVIAAYRHRGKTVMIDDGSGAKEYWWRVDTQDVSLVEKVLHEQIWEFIPGDGGQYTPAAGTNSATNPNLINCKILGFFIEGADQPMFVRTGLIYVQYDGTTGSFNLSNTNFSVGTWYKIKYRQL